jgi:CRP-like cAMP-binding protein
MSITKERPMNDRIEALRHCTVLEGFTDVGLGILAEVARERVFPNAQALQTQGEPPRDPESLVVIVKGRVRCEVRDSDGKTLGLGTLTPGDHLGGLRFFGASNVPVTAIAEGEVQVLVLDKPAFARLQRQKPQAAMKLLLALSADFGKRLGECSGLFADFAVYAAARVNILERGQYASYSDLGLDNTPTLRNQP